MIRKMCSRVEVGNLFLYAGSGTQLITSVFIDLENLEFPFTAKINYRMPNKLHSGFHD